MNNLRVALIIGNFLLLTWIVVLVIFYVDRNAYIFSLPIILLMLNIVYFIKNNSSQDNGIIALYFKRKKLEQITKIRELEEKIK